MVGNKRSGRRDSLPRGGGRPRTRVIIQMPRLVMVQLEEIAEVEHTTVLEVVRTALLEFISTWQAEHDSRESEENGGD